jgi:[ribosomal protein S18]-alanine N-acetyltransferase
MTRAFVRFLIRRDHPEVLAIERASFDYPLDEDGLIRVLRQRNCIGMVAEYGEQVVGFMIYELHKDRLDMLDFAVHPEFRRQGIGRQMVAKLVDKLSGHRRTWIALSVRESNLAGQLFFRAEGFRATEVIRGHYPDTGEDAYAMEYAIEDAGVTALAAHHQHNG